MMRPHISTNWQTGESKIRVDRGLKSGKIDEVPVSRADLFDIIRQATKAIQADDRAAERTAAES